MLDLEKHDKLLMQPKSENQNEVKNEGEYYRQMKQLAHQKRAEFGVETNKIGLKSIRAIYKSEKITIDYLDLKSPRIKAIYFCDDIDTSVGVKRSLPDEPKIFSLVHELKHHFADRQGILDGEFACGDYNENKTIEKGAEVFAAEFIFPEVEMLESLTNFGISKETITHEKVVEYKRNCGVPISYMFIKKRLTRFNIISNGEYDNVKFQSLEETLHPPIHKQPWFKKGRKQKITNSF